MTSPPVPPPSPSPATVALADQIQSGFRGIIIFASGALASHFLHSETLGAAALSAAPGVIAAVWGVWKWSRAHRTIADLRELVRELIIA